MTLIEFIARIQVAYPREKLGKLRLLYMEELAQFTERQLESMFSPIIRSCTFLPKLSEIFKVAGQLDFLFAPVSKSISPQKPKDTPESEAAHQKFRKEFYDYVGKPYDPAIQEYLRGQRGQKGGP